MTSKELILGASNPRNVKEELQHKSEKLATPKALISSKTSANIGISAVFLTSVNPPYNFILEI